MGPESHGHFSHRESGIIQNAALRNLLQALII